MAGWMPNLPDPSVPLGFTEAGKRRSGAPRRSTSKGALIFAPKASLGVSALALGILGFRTAGRRSQDRVFITMAGRGASSLNVR